MTSAVARLIGVVVIGILYGLWKAIVAICEWIGSLFSQTQRQQEVKQEVIANEDRYKVYRERRERESEEREKREKEFIEKYKSLSVEEILLKDELGDFDKTRLLTEIHKYNYGDAKELIKTAERAQRKARLDSIKRKVTQKAHERYGNIPSDDNRKPIPDEVKLYVWSRDKGKCVNCGSNESLEFDHIIPVAKGGNSTERNIQLLCEKCNREKSDNI